ncbi:MAG: hypothetical protein GEU28_08180 [Dehalococcoidia bacterium]|nr:hypothetical protein [Dehalococcoidia bacterium]
MRSYERDQNWADNEEFVALLPELGAGLPIYALLEYIGIASFNHNPRQLERLVSATLLDLRLSLIFPRPSSEEPLAALHDEIFIKAYEYMKQRQMSYGDAQVLRLAEEDGRHDLFVTWNARHFRGRSPIEIITPAQLVRRLKLNASGA